jgi:hypothetical protein
VAKVPARQVTANEKRHVDGVAPGGTVSNMACSTLGCTNQPRVFALILLSRANLTERAYCEGHAHNLCIEYSLPELDRVHLESLPLTYEQCELFAVLSRFDPDEFTLILRSNESSLALVVPTGYLEVGIIYNHAKNTPPRGNRSPIC